VYCGTIAFLLIMLPTGRKPTKRTFEIVSFSLSGWASADDSSNSLPEQNPPATSMPQPAG